jgi:hypothetical protein
MLTSFKAGLPKRWRLRLKAGALALSFVFLSLLPWAHVMTLGSQDGHGCCHHAAAEAQAGDIPALVSAVTDTSAACWVCDSLASLLHPNVLTDAQNLVRPSLSSIYDARATNAPMISQIYPASRSQAPPASA